VRPLKNTPFRPIPASGEIFLSVKLENNFITHMLKYFHKNSFFQKIALQRTHEKNQAGGTLRNLSKTRPIHKKSAFRKILCYDTFYTISVFQKILTKCSLAEGWGFEKSICFIACISDDICFIRMFCAWNQ
jgi:hypothetical protein